MAKVWKGKATSCATKVARRKMKVFFKESSSSSAY